MKNAFSRGGEGWKLCGGARWRRAAFPPQDFVGHVSFNPLPSPPFFRGNFPPRKLRFHVRTCSWILTWRKILVSVKVWNFPRSPIVPIVGIPFQSKDERRRPSSWLVDPTGPFIIPRNIARDVVWLRKKKDFARFIGLMINRGSLFIAHFLPLPSFFS